MEHGRIRRYENAAVRAGTLHHGATEAPIKHREEEEFSREAACSQRHLGGQSVFVPFILPVPDVKLLLVSSAILLQSPWLRGENRTQVRVVTVAC